MESTQTASLGGRVPRHVAGQAVLARSLAKHEQSLNHQLTSRATSSTLRKILLGFGVAMDDKANIQSAYNNAVQGIFKVFFEDLAAADGDAAAEATAQTEFKAGLNIARKALAAALTLI